MPNENPMNPVPEKPTATCCTVTPNTAFSRQCRECGRPGRAVERITVKAMLRPEALMRLSAPEHRYCSTPSCRVVYFGDAETFGLEEIVVPVFHKEPAGDRTVCYCFGVNESEIRRELIGADHSTIEDRIKALVQAQRCACEVKNPQGSCCLGNVAAAVTAAAGAWDKIGSRHPRPPEVQDLKLDDPTNQ